MQRPSTSDRGSSERPSTSRAYSRKNTGNNMIMASDNPKFANVQVNMFAPPEPSKADERRKEGYIKDQPTVAAAGGRIDGPNKMDGTSKTERMLKQKGIDLTYDPKQPSEGAQPRGTDLAAFPPVAIPVGVPKSPIQRAIHVPDVESFLTSPGPRDYLLHFRVSRNNRGLKGKLFPQYDMVLEDGERFMLSAKKRKKQKTSSYLISRDKVPSKRSDGVMAKVRSNFLGTEFLLYDNGNNPTKTDAEGAVRCEIGCIHFEKNFQGKCPRKMRIAVPSRDPSGLMALWQPTKAEPNHSLSSQVLNSTPTSSAVIMVNKEPIWDDARACYTINFNGRVSVASVKNFQLMIEGGDESIVMQFGKTGKSTFSLDVRWPLSPVQAFSIVMSAFDNKFGAQ